MQKLEDSQMKLTTKFKFVVGRNQLLDLYLCINSLIPGLLDDIALCCLFRLPVKFHLTGRTFSRQWGGGGLSERNVHNGSGAGQNTEPHFSFPVVSSDGVDDINSPGNLSNGTSGTITPFPRGVWWQGGDERWRQEWRLKIRLKILMTRISPSSNSSADS
ncbi:hypothetical protein L1887_11686 [Cichorium endivia]|nr:hypothetical protein L1887_11686 [Cichorium endivia]